MTWEWFALAAMGLGVLGLVALLFRQRARTAREMATARTDAAELRARLERLEVRASPEPPTITLRDEQEYQITRVGDPDLDGEAMQPAQLDRAVFADLLLKESLIRVGSLAHGVRRALSPENRNRIRFEMKREVKRARKQRRAERREAYREWQARRRAELTDEDLRESA